MVGALQLEGCHGVEGCHGIGGEQNALRYPLANAIADLPEQLFGGDE